MDITVAICTYNGAERVPEVLDHLRRQDVASDIRWEVMVVDNNSKDHTSTVVQEHGASWPKSVPLKYVLEEQQGLAYARQHAVEVAQGEFVAFLDDDNLPNPDWVQQAVKFGRAHPRAGSFGGRILGDYEIEPPKSFGLVQGLFAINEGTKTFCYSDKATGEFPPGAGMVVRRKAWLEAVPAELANTGVTGNSRASTGEDIEAQWYIHAAGWEVWHNARMVCRHRIPAGRFSEPYLVSFFEGIAASRRSTRRLRYSTWQWPLMAAAFWLNDMRLYFQYLIRYRKQLDDPFVRGRLRMQLHLVRPSQILR